MEEGSNTVEKNKEKMPSAAVPPVSSHCGEEESLADAETKSSFKNLCCTWWKGIYSLPVPRINVEDSETGDDIGESICSSNSNNNHEESEYVFLDLFFVPAMSNTAELLLSIVKSNTLNPGSANYATFFAVFFGVWIAWLEQTWMHAKYRSHDVFHKFVKRFQILCISISIFHIKEVHEMYDGTTTPPQLWFCLGLVLHSFITLLLESELHFFSPIPAVKNESKRTISCYLVWRLVLYITATVMARSESIAWVICIFVGGLFPITIHIAFFQRIYNYYKNGRWEKSILADVPLEQSVVRERVGEWVNITLGDSVFTLLMAGNSSEWVHVILGIVSTILFHCFYFYSGGQIMENHDKKKNALRQLYLVGWLSMAWLGISISYKTGLTTNHYLRSEVQPIEGGKEEGNGTLTVLDLINLGVLNKYDIEIITETKEIIRSGSFSGLIIPGEDEGEDIFTNHYQRRINQFYFTCLCASILILEVIFWSSNMQLRQARRKAFSLEGSAAASRKCCFWGMYFLQYSCVITVLVCGHTVERMYMLGAAYTYAIGIALLTISSLIRYAVRRMLDNAIAESERQLVG